MLHEDGLDLIALVEERGGIGVGAERRTIEQLAKPEDRAHRKGEIAVGSRVDAIRRAKIRVGIVHRAALRRLAAIIEIRGQNLELKIED